MEQSLAKLREEMQRGRQIRNNTRRVRPNSSSSSDGEVVVFQAQPKSSPAEEVILFRGRRNSRRRSPRGSPRGSPRLTTIQNIQFEEILERAATRGFMEADMHSSTRTGTRNDVDLVVRELKHAVANQASPEELEELERKLWVQLAKSL